MTRWMCRTTIAVMLVGLTPLPAAAQFWELIKWLDDMSGPQMWGYVFEIPAWCRYDSGEHKFVICPPFDGTARRQGSVALRVGQFFNDQELGNETFVRDIDMQLWGVAGRWSPATNPALDVVGGFDMVKFSGPTVTDFWVPTADVGLVVRPVGLWRPLQASSHAVSVSWRYKFFFKEFGGDRFGAPGTFTSDHEGISQFSVNLDLGYIGGRIFR